jgi:hypothetical protein
MTESTARRPRSRRGPAELASGHGGVPQRSSGLDRILAARAEGPGVDTV